KIQPEKEVKISADVSGEIVELYVKEGQEVKQGDLLLKIKPDIYVSNLDRMEASLNSAKSNLSNAKARLSQVEARFIQAEQAYQRSKKLHEQNAISESDYENAVSEFQVAKAEVDAAKETVSASEFAVLSSEASLKEASENLKKTSIYSPIDGTISLLNVEQGERVVGTIQMAGTEILRIANLNRMEAKVEVNENDIIHVSLGDTAIIEVDAYLDKEFKGIVTEVANSANTQGVSTDQVTSFDVKVRILQSSYENLTPKDSVNKYPFRPGMTATVDIQTETHKNVLAIPIQAVTTRTDSTEIVKTDKEDQIVEQNKDEQLEVVFVFDNGKAIQKTVKTGIQDDEFIEIIEGLEEKVEVITAPYSLISKKLKDNMVVEKGDKNNLFTEE
ncbi:MAG: efflux transporter periplasmic adaptor subunit, partial [Bacteroidetes bacterium RIFOXYA2_FULL_33_7]